MPGIVLGLVFVQVGPDFSVYLFYIPNTGLKLCRRLVLQVRNRHLCNFNVMPNRFPLLTLLFQFLFQLCDLCVQSDALVLERFQVVPLALVLAIPGKYLLLLLDQFCG